MAAKQAKTVRFSPSTKPPSSPATPTTEPRTGPAALDNVRSITMYIQKALNAKAQGDPSDYFEIITLLQLRPPQRNSLSAEALVLWVRAFSQVVSCLSSPFHSVVDALLAIDWTVQDDAFVKAYAHLMENLVSAHAFYVVPVAKMLIGKLRWGAESLPQSHALFDRIHAILSSIVRIIPTGPTFMLPLLAENFPHKREELSVQVHYVRNIFRILEYAPVLRDKALALIIDRVLQIDVDIQIELEEMDEEVWEDVQRAVFNADAGGNPDTHIHPLPSHTPLFDANGRALPTELESDSDDDIDFDSDDEEGISPVAIEIKPTVEKLDAMLRLVLQFLKDYRVKRPDEDLQELFAGLLDVFDAAVLSTHRMRCAQFIWFYAASLHVDFPGYFVTALVRRGLDDQTPDMIRVSAIAYLGSFLARFVCVDLPFVRDVLGLLNNWAGQYVDQYEDGKAADPERHGPFYAVVQAVVYVFCFRWEKLLEREDGTVMRGRWPAELVGFHRVLTSAKFMPLKICSRSICEEFNRLTRTQEIFNYFQYMDGPTVLSRHASSTSLKSQDTTSDANIPPAPASPTNGHGTSGATTRTVERLEAFFPFDPLPLPASKRFIEHIYMEWHGGGDESESEGGTGSLAGSSVGDPMFLGVSLEDRMLSTSLEERRSWR
ncbi:hypothetical protein HK104_003021 [Borealophlyctis nickersoniae]|nr:hypothetical protein HK104_003021 [Borealophlyctis nickersoniae]